MGPDPAPSPDAQPAGRKSRLHYVYFLLAGFDLLTVCLSLLLINWITDIHVDAVAANRVWAERLGAVSELSQLAAEVNTPGNDVFDSGDVEAEGQRLTLALSRFDDRAGEIRADLGSTEEGGSRGYLEFLDQVDAGMQALVTDAQVVFDLLRSGETGTAGERMASMDRHFVRVNSLLGELGTAVRAVQQADLAEQSAKASTIRRFEVILAILIVLMISGVTFYGARLARQVKLEAQMREQLIAERTHELEESHQQLRLAERLASMGTLAAGLGHDMNNILFPVRCHLDVLEATELEEQARSELTAIRGSINYLQKLTDGLRLLSQQSDRGHGPSEGTQPAAWWGEVEPLMRTALPGDVELEVHIESGLPALAIESQRLTQAILNLIVNAGEAIASKGKVVVTMDRIPDTVEVSLSVSDTGVGMDEDVRSRVLDPFFTTKPRSLSTGLGLALVHSVVRGVSGSIHIDSEPGVGTTVELRIPLEHTPADSIIVSPPPTALVTIADPRIKSFVMSFLESRGYVTTDEADTASRFDLVICDVQQAADAPDVSSDRVVVLGTPEHPVPPRWTVVDMDAWMSGLRAALDTPQASQEMAS